MEVTFDTPKLQKTCESEKDLQRRYGKPSGTKVMQRLVDLRAATSLADFRRLPGRRHELSGDRKGQLALELAGAMRLVFRPTQDPPPQGPGGGLDWKQVDAVLVLEIVDYHG